MARVKNEPDAAEIAVAEHVAAVVAANPRGAPITIHEAPPPPKEKEPFCVLDDQPVNSVLVVLQEPGGPAEPWLQTPAGKVDVPRDDMAWKLPILAEIKKTGPRSFVAMQRDDQYGKPKLVCSSAAEACRVFKRHFHNERD